MEIFYEGQTVRIYEEVRTFDDVLADPTTIKVTITDPTGTVKVNALAMTKYNSETGKYEYYYNLPASPNKGNWHVYVTVVDGTGDTAKTTPDYGTFTVA
jgi:uncharacterized protein YfaS (alpha-2-macroglobulin family)